MTCQNLSARRKARLRWQRHVLSGGAAIPAGFFLVVIARFSGWGMWWLGMLIMALNFSSLVVLFNPGDDDALHRPTWVSLRNWLGLILLGGLAGVVIAVLVHVLPVRAAAAVLIGCLWVGLDYAARDGHPHPGLAVKWEAKDCAKGWT